MPWVKGQSGNAKGRPKGSHDLARYIRVQTRQGAELVEFALKVMRDESAPIMARQAEKAWLADRGWGKAVEHIEIEETKNAAPGMIASDVLEAAVGNPDEFIQ